MPQTSTKFQVFTTNTFSTVCVLLTLHNVLQVSAPALQAHLDPASSNQNGPMMPCFDMATQAVHFTECNGLWRQCSGGVLPQKTLFFEFT